MYMTAIINKKLSSSGAGSIYKENIFMINTLKKTLICLLVPLFSSTVIYAASRAVSILEAAPDARATAMGTAFTSVGGDACSLNNNPAGISSVNNSELVFSNNRSFTGVEQQYIGYVYNLHDIRSSNLKDLGSLGLSFTDLNYNSFDATRAYKTGQGVIGAHDRVFSASYGKTIIETAGFGIFSAGISGKLIIEEFDADSFKNNAFSAGALWQTAFTKGLSFGMVLDNFGSNLKYSSIGEALPAIFKTGASYRAFGGSALFALDIINPSGTSNIYYRAGAEYHPADSVAIRAGYDDQKKIGSGLTAGFGLIVKQLDIFFLFARELDIDYSYVPYGDLGETHRITLNFKLGAD
jgi:hypothetical protein